VPEQHPTKMPTDLTESVAASVELVFPDEATRNQYSLRERSVYDADEVRDEIGSDDVPQYGKWLPVTLDGEDGWLIAPSELRTALVEKSIRQGEPFRIATMKKTGSRQSDPYSVEVKLLDRDAEQTGLPESAADD